MMKVMMTCLMLTLFCFAQGVAQDSKQGQAACDDPKAEHCEQKQKGLNGIATPDDTLKLQGTQSEPIQYQSTSKSKRNKNGFGHSYKGLKLRMLKPMILGGCNPRVVQKVLKKSERKLQRCISKKVKANVESIGQLSLAWSIDGRGKIRNLRVSKSTLKNDNITRCLQKGLQGLSFPKLGSAKCMVRQKLRVLPK